MDLYLLLAIAIGVGWIAWSIRGPTVQSVIDWTDGRLTVKGPVSPHQKQELQEFFASQFENVPQLKVTILAQSLSKPTRPRIRVHGVSSASEVQAIRNFLTSRL